MYQPPNSSSNPFEGSSPNPFNDAGIPADPVFQRLDDDLPTPAAIQQNDIMPQLKKLYIALIAAGLITGLVISIAVLRVINHFGLSDAPQPKSEFVN
ncbi:MAG: hypothetical protein HC795_06675 [Coleofasciculaceae cyanobacterium RL_1_1]|nr:hypothetical protein [Coleofasciculaceae cyanobacterium RL_1_1]